MRSVITVRMRPLTISKVNTALQLLLIATALLLHGVRRCRVRRLLQAMIWVVAATHGAVGGGLRPARWFGEPSVRRRADAEIMDPARTVEVVVPGRDAADDAGAADGRCWPGCFGGRVRGAVFYLFSSILLPFVAAACIAYFLDPPTTRLARIGMPRGAWRPGS